MTKSEEKFLVETNKYLNTLLDEKDKEIKKLNTTVVELRKELKDLRKEYYGEVRANQQILDGNTRLFDECKWLKRDVKRISKVSEYLDYCKENKCDCSIKTIKNMLVGTDKENLDDYVDV